MKGAQKGVGNESHAPCQVVVLSNNSHDEIQVSLSTSAGTGNCDRPIVINSSAMMMKAG